MWQVEPRQPYSQRVIGMQVSPCEAAQMASASALSGLRLHGFQPVFEPSPVFAVTLSAYNTGIGIDGKDSESCTIKQLEPLQSTLILIWRTAGRGV